MNINEPVSVVGLHLVVLPNRLAPTSELSTGSWKTAGFAQQLWRGLGLRAPTRAPTGHTTRSAGPHGPHGAPTWARWHSALRIRTVSRQENPACILCLHKGLCRWASRHSLQLSNKARIHEDSTHLTASFHFHFHCHEGASNAGQVSRSVWLR